MRMSGIGRNAVLAGGALIALGAAPAQAREVHATPTGTGKDCTEAQPCSIVGAQTLSRRLLLRGETVEVVLAGHFELAAPIVLDARDSGRNGRPAVWRAAAGKEAVLDASRPITGIASGSTIVLKTRPGDRLTGLYRDGRIAPLSGTKECNDCTITKEGVILPREGWGNLKPGAIVTLHARWRDFHCRVTAVEGTLVRTVQPCWHNSWIDSKNGWRNASPFGKGYTGVQSFRNVAPETQAYAKETYAIDLATRTLTYRQTEDKKRLAELGEPKFRIATNERLFIIRGTRAQPTHDIAIRGLRFTGTGWDQSLTDDGYVSLQAGYYIAGRGKEKLRDDGEGHEHVPAAVDVSYATRIAVTDSVFSNMGAAGISLGAGVSKSSVDRSRFFYLGGSAIFAGLTTIPARVGGDTLSDVRIVGNDVWRVAEIYRDNVGITVGYVHGLNLASNWIHDVPYSGLSVGWGWNYAGEAPNHRDIRIERNRIDHVMRELHDGGGIYTQGVSTPGSVITANYVDMRGAGDGNGIYLDEKSTNFDVQRNVVLGSWISSWSTWSKNLNITRNWTDTRGTEHYPGPTKNWKGNWPNIVILPPHAVEVVNASGPDAAQSEPSS